MSLIPEFESQVKEADGQQPRITFKHYYEYDLKPPEYIIEGLAEADSIINNSGDPGSAKSLFWQDAFFCIGAGIPFHGREVKQRSVLMFIGEGLHGVLRRFKALEIRYDVERPPVLITPVSALLSEKGADKEMIEAIDRLPSQTIRAVCFDTLARNFGSGNENATQDMNVAVHNMDQVRRHLDGAAMVPIHHLGVADKTRSRGSSVLKGAADTEYIFTKDSKGIIRVICTKQKDGEHPAPLAFRIGTVDIGMKDAHGKDVCPPVLSPVEYTPDLGAGGVRIGSTERALLGMMQVLQDTGTDPTEKDARATFRKNGYSNNQISNTLKRMREKRLIRMYDGHIKVNEIDELYE